MINKLIANIKKTGAPIVVGLDPMLNYIPKQIQEEMCIRDRHLGRLSFLYEKIGKVYPVIRFFIDFISKFLKNITILLIFVSKC